MPVWFNNNWKNNRVGRVSCVLSHNRKITQTQCFPTSNLRTEGSPGKLLPPLDPSDKTRSLCQNKSNLATQVRGINWLTGSLTKNKEPGETLSLQTGVTGRGRLAEPGKGSQPNKQPRLGSFVVLPPRDSPPLPKHTEVGNEGQAKGTQITASCQV